MVSNKQLIIKKSGPLSGSVSLFGAKNAVLPIMASLILTNGKSILHNAPDSADTHQMVQLLKNLGANVNFDNEKHIIEVDTTNINSYTVDPEIMNKMRASILVMGPLLARFGKANVAQPGGCLIGARPIDLHLKGFEKLNAQIKQKDYFLNATLKKSPGDRRIALEYPSIGATENLLMCAVLIPGTTTIINAALEPEVFDVITVLQKMGAQITYGKGLEISITGVNALQPIEHTILPDRLEAGSLLLAAAITGGEISIPNAQPYYMDIFLQKLEEMGHMIDRTNGISIKATKFPRAVNFKTAPYPGFPTDFQAPMMAALCLADGTSKVEETVFENRLMHAEELKKMGAQISVTGNKATIRGVDELYGCDVIASDIRASCALAISGLVAQGTTTMTGISHWKRGYDGLEKKLAVLGGRIVLD